MKNKYANQNDLRWLVEIKYSTLNKIKYIGGTARQRHTDAQSRSQQKILLPSVRQNHKRAKQVSVEKLNENLTSKPRAASQMEYTPMSERMASTLHVDETRTARPTRVGRLLELSWLRRRAQGAGPSATISKMRIDSGWHPEKSDVMKNSTLRLSLRC